MSHWYKHIIKLVVLFFFLTPLFLNAQSSAEENTVPPVTAPGVEEDAQSTDSSTEKEQSAAEKEEADGETQSSPAATGDNQTSAPEQPVVKKVVYKPSLKLLDIQDKDFTAARLPGYTPQKKQQMLAELEEPEVEQTTEVENNKEDDDTVSKEDNSKPVIKGFEFSVSKETWNNLARGGLVIVLVGLVFLARFTSRRSRRKRRVFRKIPSKRR